MISLESKIWQISSWSILFRRYDGRSVLDLFWLDTLYTEEDSVFKLSWTIANKDGLWFYGVSNHKNILLSVLFASIFGMSLVKVGFGVPVADLQVSIEFPLPW